MFQAGAQPLHFFRIDLFRAGAEHALDLVDGGIEFERQHFFLRVAVLVATQLESQLPALAAVLGDAMHVERADFAQGRHQLHRDLARCAARGAQHGGDGRQAHYPGRIEVGQFAGLRR